MNKGRRRVFPRHSVEGRRRIVVDSGVPKRPLSTRNQDRLAAPPEPDSLFLLHEPTPGSIRPLTPSPKDRAIALLDEWMADESGYDEETWPELKEALNRERDNISARRLFDD